MKIAIHVNIELISCSVRVSFLSMLFDVDLHVIIYVFGVFQKSLKKIPNISLLVLS